MSQHVTPAYKRYFWKLYWVLDLKAHLNKVSASMRRKLSPPQQISAVFVASIISLSFAALWFSTSVKGGGATEIISRIRWIPIFCMFRAVDQTFRYGESPANFPAFLLLMGVISNYFLDKHILNQDVSYSILVDTICLIRIYIELFNKVFDDRPEDFENPDIFRVTDLIFMISSIVTGLIGVAILLWLVYRLVYGLYLFPPFLSRVEDAEGILEFLWLFSKSVEAHLLITGILFMGDFVTLIGDLTVPTPPIDNDFTGLAMSIAGRMRQIFDMLLVGHFGLRFSGNISGLDFFLITAFLFSGWLFNCLLEGLHQTPDNKKEKVDPELTET